MVDINDVASAIKEIQLPATIDNVFNKLKTLEQPVTVVMQFQNKDSELIATVLVNLEDIQGRMNLIEYLINHPTKIGQ